MVVLVGNSTLLIKECRRKELGVVFNELCTERENSQQLTEVLEFSSSIIFYFITKAIHCATYWEHNCLQHNFYRYQKKKLIRKLMVVQL